MCCFSWYLALQLKKNCNTALILIQNKALDIWNSLMQKSGFPKMHHYVGVFFAIMLQKATVLYA